MTLHEDTWHNGLAQPCLGPVHRSKSSVKVQGHMTKIFLFRTKVKAKLGKSVTAHGRLKTGFEIITDNIARSVGQSSPYYEDMWRTYSCLISFFPIVVTCLRCEDVARQSCAMVPRWRFLATFLRPVSSASRVQNVSDLHLKFALRSQSHHVWKYDRHPICDG